MIEFEEWYQSTDVHEGTNVFYNYLWDLGQDKVSMISIEETHLDNVQFLNGSMQDLEEDVLVNYDFEPMDINPLARLIVARLMGDR